MEWHYIQNKCHWKYKLCAKFDAFLTKCTKSSYLCAMLLYYYTIIYKYNSTVSKQLYSIEYCAGKLIAIIVQESISLHI